jgi:hypothetical protein
VRSKHLWQPSQCPSRSVQARTTVSSLARVSLRSRFAPSVERSSRWSPVLSRVYPGRSRQGWCPVSSRVLGSFGVECPSRGATHQPMRASAREHSPTPEAHLGVLTFRPDCLPRSGSTSPPEVRSRISILGLARRAPGQSAERRRVTTSLSPRRSHERKSLGPKMASTQFCDDARLILLTARNATTRTHDGCDLKRLHLLGADSEAHERHQLREWVAVTKARKSLSRAGPRPSPREPQCARGLCVKPTSEHAMPQCGERPKGAKWRPRTECSPEVRISVRAQCGPRVTRPAPWRHRAFSMPRQPASRQKV